VGVRRFLLVLLADVRPGLGCLGFHMAHLGVEQVEFGLHLPDVGFAVGHGNSLD
jgi:hypothetical protein